MEDFVTESTPRLLKAVMASWWGLAHTAWPLAKRLMTVVWLCASSSAC